MPRKLLKISNLFREMGGTEGVAPSYIFVARQPSSVAIITVASPVLHHSCAGFLPRRPKLPARKQSLDV